MPARQSCYRLYFVSVIAFPNPKYRFDEGIDNSHYRLILKLGKEMQINHYSKKEHTKISKIAKFGCEML